MFAYSYSGMALGAFLVFSAVSFVTLTVALAPGSLERSKAMAQGS
jgi:hypothetical protein